jgi:mycothiol synthase
VASSAVAVSVTAALTEAQSVQVRSALERTTAADGVGPLSEEARLRLAPGESGATHLLVEGDDGVGYAQLATGDEATLELFVAPEARRRGVGTALLVAAREQTPAFAVWAHGDLPAAAALAERHGLRRTRELWQMRRPLDASLTAPPIPAGFTVRPFVPGQDEAAWLALNAAAFARHPEQGSWTTHDLELREQEPWFDPAGFFLAERAGELVGFHWTKVHPPSASEPEPLGEVYVLGVAPTAAGDGLGSLLTAVGLAHLAARGLSTVLLYVEADNTPALRVYERQGFSRHAVDVQYRT